MANLIGITHLYFSMFIQSVEHLSKYLAMRLTLDLDTELTATERLNNFCIYIAPQPSQFLILNGNQTLQQVNEKFWKVKSTDFLLKHLN